MPTTFTKVDNIVTTDTGSESISEFQEKYSVGIDESNNMFLSCTTDVDKKFFHLIAMENVSFDGYTPSNREDLQTLINQYFYKQVSDASSSGVQSVTGTAVNNADPLNPVVDLPTGGGSTNNIQFKDEGVNLGTAGTVTAVNFTGAAVVATRAVDQVNVAVAQSRFGVTGEDVTAAQNRSFNLGASFLMTINSANPAGPALTVNNTQSSGIKITTQGAFAIDATSEGNAIVGTTHGTFSGISGQAILGGIGVSGNTSNGTGVIGTSQAGGIPIAAVATGSDVSSILPGIKLIRQNNVNNGSLAGQGVSFDIFNKNSTNSVENVSSFIWKYTNAVNPSASTLQIQMKSNSSGAMIDVITANGLGDVTFPNIRTYANDAAADADATLLTKSFYKITGNRTVFQKP